MYCKVPLAILLTTLACVLCCAAGTEKVLHTFQNSDGVNPQWGVIRDGAGNLYGATTGTAFELSPVSGGGWAFDIIYDFRNGPETPTGGLVMDGSGNLYGNAINSHDDGSIYEVSPSSNGWAYTTLDTFPGSPALGSEPMGSLIFDTAGNLYDTTQFGGAYGFGTVFELSLGQDGSWTEKTLYSFPGGSGGAFPAVGLTFDGTGNLYGTTVSGGQGNNICNDQYSEPYCGVVFKLSPGPNGSWTETTLWEFTGNGDGGNPYTTVSIDGQGSLYATTRDGGFGYGAIFSGVPGVGGRVIYDFNGPYGENASSGLLFDSVGNFYGTTAYADLNYGEVFKGTPVPGGGWKGSLLYIFTGKADGVRPLAISYLIPPGISTEPHRWEDQERTAVVWCTRSHRKIVLACW